MLEGEARFRAEHSPVAIAGTVACALATPAGAHPGQVGCVSLAVATALLAGSLPTIALTNRVLVGREIPDPVHAVAYLILLGIILIAMVGTMAA